MITSEKLSASNRTATSSRFKEMREHYLSNANETIQKKEFRKASELLWGGIAQTLKLLASLSGIQLNSHNDFRIFIDKAAEETEDESLFQDYTYLETLHRNFYDEVIGEKYFMSYYKRTYEFLQKLDKLIQDKTSN